MIVRDLVLGHWLRGRKLVDEFRLQGQLQNALQHLVQLCRAQRILLRRFEAFDIVVPCKEVPKVGAGQNLACPKSLNQCVVGYIELQYLCPLQKLFYESAEQDTISRQLVSRALHAFEVSSDLQSLVHSWLIPTLTSFPLRKL